MASTLPFSIVDVFSTTPYRGNPLAVVSTISPASGPLTKSQYQHITRQFNLSETTFFAAPSLKKAHYALRSFLPDGKEVFGAGHNILGVWWHLASAGLLDLTSGSETAIKIKENSDNHEEWEFWQELGGDVLPVRILRSQAGEIKVSIRQAPPKSHAFHPNLASLSQAVGIQESDIGFQNSTKLLRPQVLSTSTTKHLQVPLASIEALNRVAVQKDALLQQLALVDDHAYGLYLFTRVPGENNSYQARFFSPGMSGEDPATGSAAGPLAFYLYEHGELELENGVGVITVIQGLKVGREYLITVTLTRGSDGVVNVDFSGGGVSVANGDIALPAADLTF